MAQYGVNFYGTSWYGRIRAFSGSYETHAIYTKEALVGTTQVSAQVDLPKALYKPLAPEFLIQKGTWTIDSGKTTWSTTQAGAAVQFQATGSKLEIVYAAALTSAKEVTVKVESETEAGKQPVQTYTFSTQGSPNLSATYVIPNIQYGMHIVTISLPDTHTGERFDFKGVRAQTSHIRMEMQAKVKGGAWNTYAPLTFTEKPASNGQTLLTATSPDYKGCDYVRIKIWMASSDDLTSPSVFWLQVIGGNASERSKNGQWTAVIDLKRLAQDKTLTFKEVTSIHYKADEPEGTTLWVRSSSSTDNVVYSKVSCPYKNNVGRIRLKPGRTYGYIDSPYIAPSNGSVTGTKKGLVRNLKWDVWEDQSYRPPENTDTSIFYNFIDYTKNMDAPYDRFEPYSRTHKGMKKPTDQDFFLRIELRRRIDKSTPVVDFVNFRSWMEYKEDIVKNTQQTSAVHNNNTGKEMVLDMNTIQFNYPKYTPALPGVSLPTDFEYHLLDEVKRPTDLLLYWESESKKFDRTNLSRNPKDKVYSEVLRQTKPGALGVPLHYQYGGGSMVYGETEEIVMAPTFTPNLTKGKQYRYYVTSGWPDEMHFTVKGDRTRYIAMKFGVLEDELIALNPGLLYEANGMLVEGQFVKIPNKTKNPVIGLSFKGTTQAYTEKSSHNAYETGNANKESDTLVVIVNRPPQEEDVDWVSEEKIFSGVVNPNDVRKEFKRTYLIPDTQDAVTFFYVVKAGDTWKTIADKFSIYIEDLLKENEADEATQLVVGKKIIVPAPITLPIIHPKAKIIGNPYVVEIIAGSVKKKDETPLAEDTIQLKVMDITYRKATITKELRVRGAVGNGKDVLGNARVSNIKRVESKDGMIQYNEYNDIAKIGDFKRNGNYIDWSPAGGIEPKAGDEYYVTYECEVPESVTIHMDTTYKEEGGVDKVWRSPEVKHFTGICSPGKDFSMELPSPTTWDGARGVEDLQFVVEDNDLWVQTWVDKVDGKYFLKGSLKDRVPKDNWFPTIKNGYYYLGQKEHFLYSEPITTVYGEDEIPQARQVAYTQGKFDGAVQLEPEATNYILNSGFLITSKKTLFKKQFKQV
ncbi:virion structural protein_gp083 [Bacillus phage vB_BceM_WH1]|nr:virion structural protein_gp083 [Bacillus phage vB_BceM_WH1]